MAIKSSAELQKVSLSAMLKDQDLLSQVKQYVSEEFFDNLAYKLIYKSLSYYYTKTNKLPTVSELMIVVGDLFTTNYGSFDDIRAAVSDLYNTQVTDSDFLSDKLSTFIKRNRVESTLKELLPQIQKGSELAIEDIGTKLMESVSLEINTVKGFSLADTERLAMVREEAIGTTDNPTVIRSCIPDINKALTFKGYKPGDVVMFVSAPGSGKTMWMINECSNAALQGFHALHVFVGDMKEYDGFVRYASRLTGVPQDDIVAMSTVDQANLVHNSNYNGVFNRLVMKSYPAGTISASKMAADIVQMQKDLGVHFDIIAIDYPDNLIPESVMMYESGGDIYNSIAKFGYTNRSVMLTGSQPKINYWKDEIIPVEGAAESSRKQHVVDVMITAGKPFRDSTMITYHLAKVRRGSVGGIVRVKSSFERAYLEQTTEKEYLQYRGDNM